MFEVIRIFYYYSGLVTFILSFLFFVTPFLICRKKHNLQLISEVPLSIKSRITFVDLGVYLTSLTQIIFSLFLFNNSLVLGKLGAIFLLLGSLCFLIAGYFNIYKKRKYHTRLVNVYAIFLLLSLQLISLDVLTVNIMGVVLPVVIILAAIIVTLLYFMNKKWQAEIVMIVLTGVWVIFYYVFLISF